MFFPVIDYGYYQRYSTHVTYDMREYIKIMSVESNRVPAKDAALVIGWNEILKRALTQEKFINQYPDSVKINDIKELYKKYLTFTLFGLNNTPLFDYDSKEMVTEAKNVYQKVVDNNENSIFIETLQEYLDLLKANNYRLTEEVDKYRKSIVENLLSAFDSNKTTQKEIIAAMQSDIDSLKKESSVQQI